MSYKHAYWYNEHDDELTEFKNCSFVDISLTPLTNTFAVRKLKLAVGGSAIIPVNYIDVLTKKLSEAKQKYSRLSVDVYRYENLGTGLQPT